jgi:AcrR family transcriptional regulator
MPRKQRIFGEQARSVALLWQTPAQRRRGPKPELSHERIVAVAVAVADAHGLEAVSMDRVARELGFTAMSLYRHVPGKRELVDLMIDVGLGPPPPLDGPPRAWRKKLTRWAQALWSVFHAHPWSLEATGRLRVMGPNELAWLEAGLGALAPTGLRPGERRAACLALLSQVRGMAQFSVGNGHPPRHSLGGAASLRSPIAPARGQRGLSGAEWRAATAELMRDHGERYPNLVATLSEHRPEPEPLQLGLRCLLDGIERRIAR